MSSSDLLLPPESQGETPIPIPVYQTPRLTVATFNLTGNRDQEYIESFASDMLAREVDVVCVQGSTRLNRETLFRSFKQRGYLYTRFDQMNIRDTGEIMFYSSRVCITKKEYTPFASSLQSRGVSRYRITLKNKDQAQDVWVSTSHMEEGSGGNSYRRGQISEINSLFSVDQTPAIFAGDTSIPSWQDLREPKGWLDGWREKGTSDNEKTSRLDRMDQIWYNLKTSGLGCTSYQLVCLFDPDRKGVMATFEIA